MTIIEVTPIFVLIAGALFMYKVYLHGKMKKSNKLNKPSFLLPKVENIYYFCQLVKRKYQKNN